MYCAMADLAAEYGDSELLKCCETLWDNIVTKRMYITGSIGSSAFLERFTIDYDLPNDMNYSETCASVGLALFGLRMANLKQDASYIDTVERALYNNIRAGISLEGNRYFYVNPLEVWPESCLDHTSKAHVKPVRQKWFDVACCPTNIARTLSSLGQYIYSSDDDSLTINLFVQNSVNVKIKGSDVAVQMITDFPKTSKIKICITANGTKEFPVFIRIPDYAENYRVKRNGKEIKYNVENHYACLTQLWENDEIEVYFDMRSN